MLSTDLIPVRGLKRKQGDEALAFVREQLSTDLIPVRGLKQVLVLPPELRSAGFPLT